MPPLVPIYRQLPGTAVSRNLPALLIPELPGLAARVISPSMPGLRPLKPINVLRASDAAEKEEEAYNDLPPLVSFAEIPVTEVPAIQLPVPAIQLPVPAIQLPVRAIQLPVPAIQLPVPAIQLPVPAIQLPVRAIQLPVRATGLAAPEERNPEISRTGTEMVGAIPSASKEEFDDMPSLILVDEESLSALSTDALGEPIIPPSDPIDGNCGSFATN